MPDPQLDPHDDDTGNAHAAGDEHTDWSQVDALAERMAIVNADDEDDLLAFYDELAGHEPRRVPGKGLHGAG